MKKLPDSSVVRELVVGAFRLNQNPWFYQGWVKKPWQIKTSMIR